MVTEDYIFAVVDGKHCVSAINVDISRISLNEPVLCSGPTTRPMLSISQAPSRCCGKSQIPAAEQISKPVSARGPPRKPKPDYAALYMLLVK